MELATRLQRGHNGLYATGVGSAKMRGGITAEEFGALGLPEDSTSRKRAETDFADWKEASLEEYGAAFDLDVPATASHDVWTFSHNGTRYVVPALAMMRALFRPNLSVIPRLFEPQSLEDVCAFTGEGEAAGAQVALVGACRHDSTSRKRASTIAPLSWMYSFPSARAMWSSVRHRSMDGGIGLVLPRARVRLVAHGLAHARNFYVTRLVPVTLTALEDPLEFAEGHTREICFHVSNERLASGFKPNRTKDETIKLRDGQSELSDEEWEQIRPLLVSRRGGKGFTHDPRGIVDGILAKMCQGTSWTETRYPQGIEHTTVAVAYTRWRKDGRWGKLLEVLDEFRA